MIPPPRSRQEAVFVGAKLGAFKGWALGGPIAAVFSAVFLPHMWWFAVMCVIGTIFGVAGWRRDFDLKWGSVETLWDEEDWE